MKVPKLPQRPGFGDVYLEAAYRMHLARRSRQVSRGAYLCMALNLAACSIRVLLHDRLTPRRLLIITSCVLGLIVDLCTAHMLTYNTREWLARSELLKAWTFVFNTTLAMTTALLVKGGEIPLMSQLPLFHTALNSVLNYLMQFPAPTGAYLQGVFLVCSFYHEFSHWILVARKPAHFAAEMLLCLVVAYVCIAANARRDAQLRQHFLAAYKRHVAVTAAAVTATG